MADATSNIDVFADDYLGREYRSSLHTVTKSTVNVPLDPVVETSGSEQVNGAMRIDSQAGSGSWINVDYLPVSNVLLSKAFRFWGSFKIPAVSSTEYDKVYFGLRSGSTFDAVLRVEAAVANTNYKVVTRPNSGGSEIAYDTGVALPTGGASSGWLDIEFITYGSGVAADWVLSLEHVVQARGTIPSSQLPTVGVQFSCRVEKTATGSRSTQLYTDVWKVAQNA
jgi:hypothetical protein